MAEFFETRTENLEKSIPPTVPLRNNKKSKKGSKKRKSVTFDDFGDDDADQGYKGNLRTYHRSVYHSQDSG